MTTLPKMQIGEIQTRYELEPQLDDIYVEGSFDKDVLLGAFQKSKKAAPSIITIDSVLINDALLKKHQLSRGNKQSIIALSSELSQIKHKCDYKCLVDRDMDHWFPPIKSIPRLYWTKYCDIESYFLREDVIRDIIVTTCKCKVSDWDKYIKSLYSVIRSLYAFRLTDRSLGWNLRWPQYSKSLQWVKDSGEIHFDTDKQITKVLNDNSRLKDKKQFDTEYKKQLLKCVGDIKLSCRGHDYVFLLAWSVKSASGVSSYAEETAINRLMVLLASKIESDILDVLS